MRCPRQFVHSALNRRSWSISGKSQGIRNLIEFHFVLATLPLFKQSVFRELTNSAGLWFRKSRQALLPLTCTKDICVFFAPS